MKEEEFYVPVVFRKKCQESFLDWKFATKKGFL